MLTNSKKISTQMRFETREVAQRFPVNGDLEITTCTFGTTINYGFVTKNMSKSGMLIHSEVGAVPYRENTLLEINIDPHQRRIQKPISIMGKVIRRVDLESGEIDFGIAVIAELSDLEEWHQCVTSFERLALPTESAP